jgi:hypothetical protein
MLTSPNPEPSNHLTPAPFLRSLRRLQASLWQRRVIIWFMRAIWLALLVPTAVMVGYLWFGWQVDWVNWLPLMLIIGLLGLIWAMRPLKLKKVVHRLDRRLGLRASLITAFEVDHATSTAPQPDNPVTQRLLQEAVTVSISLRRQVRSLGRGFWLETTALVAVAALLGGLLLLDALTPRLPSAAAVSLPPTWQEPQADQVIPPTPELRPPPFPPEMQAGQLSPEQLQQALEALAEALRDSALTRAIAEALDRGDLAGAAAELRRLADRLDELSEETQQEVGQALQEAAEGAGGNVPGLTGPLQSGSQALTENNLEAAREALETLADALESLQPSPQESAQAPSPGDTPAESAAQPPPGNQSESPQPEAQGTEPGAGEGAGQGEGEGEGEGENGSQPSEAERLAAEGQPLELEELESDPELEDRVLQPAELSAEAGDQRAENSPFARQSATPSGDDLGPDPLTYPWDKREVVRRYFTP